MQYKTSLLHLGLNPKMMPYPIKINGPFKSKGGGISNMMQCWGLKHYPQISLKQLRHLANGMLADEEYISMCLFLYSLYR